MSIAVKNNGLGLFGTLFLFAGMVTASIAAELPAYSRGYDPARDPFADGAAALALAQQTGRRVLIELGGDWCVWCHVLDRFLTDNDQVHQQLHAHFVLLKINVSEDNDNARFLAGLPPTMGYPHMFVSAANGTILHSQDTAEFLENGHYSAERFLDFIERWRTPEPQSRVTSEVTLWQLHACRWPRRTCRIFRYPLKARLCLPFRGSFRRPA